jgi:thiol-disulfide isomerase/thioredoxin
MGFSFNYMNMKQKALLLAAVAAFAAVACTTQKVSETTLIKGTVPDSVTSIEIKMPSAKYDTVVPVVNGKFEVNMPTKKTTLAMLTAGNVSARFIPDGTPLTVSVDSINLNFTSKYPEVSSQTLYKEYAEANKNFSEKVNEGYKAVASDESALDAFWDRIQASFDSLNLAYLAKDENSFVSIMALQNLQNSFSSEQMDSVLNTLDTALANEPSIVAIRKLTDNQLATAEGKMFTDFEVDGHKLSDYVGKGKYMMVDFWASWCGPCKGEIPNIKNVYDKYHGDDFDVLSVAVWDKPEATVDTAKVYGINWNQIINAQKVPTEIYGIRGIPHIILFGPDGTILKRDLRGEEIEKTVASYVQAKK